MNNNLALSNPINLLLVVFALIFLANLTFKFGLNRQHTVVVKCNANIRSSIGSSLWLLLSFVWLILSSACSQPSQSSSQTHPSSDIEPTKTSTDRQSLRIAAAANLANVLPVIIDDYQQRAQVADRSDNQVALDIEVTYASSGKLYAQIEAGAPYDIFLSANQEFPKQLANSLQQQQSLSNPFTYVQGQLAWYSTRHPIADDAASTLPLILSIKLLSTKSVNHFKIAIANPQLAPYGASAQAYLTQMELYDSLLQQGQLIQAENIGQVFQYAHSGSVDYGLVAVSQLVATSANPSQYQILAPASYPPILQDGIVLNQRPAAHDFANYLLTPVIQQQFAQAGYLSLLPP